MADVLKRDPSLREIADLPPGWSAERDNVGSEWLRYPNDDAQQIVGRERRERELQG